MSSAAFFFLSFFSSKILSGTLSDCQMVWIQIRTDFLFVLNWIQSVFKGYEQTTKVATIKKELYNNKYEARQKNCLLAKYLQFLVLINIDGSSFINKLDIKETENIITNIDIQS